MTPQMKKIENFEKKYFFSKFWKFLKKKMQKITTCAKLGLTLFLVTIRVLKLFYIITCFLILSSKMFWSITVCFPLIFENNM